jgi:hypothetical protein
MMFPCLRQWNYLLIGFRNSPAMVLIRESGLEFAAYFNCSRNILPFEEENRTTTIHQYLQYLIHVRAQSGEEATGRHL